MKNKGVILFISKNSIYIFKDNEESVYNFDSLELELFDILEGFELKKDDIVYIFLDLYYFKIYNNKFVLDEEIKDVLYQIFKSLEFKIHLLSYVDILIEKNYGKNIMVVEDDRTYDFLFKSKNYEFKILDFKREDCEKDQIYDDYILYLSDEEIFSCIKEYENFKKIKNLYTKNLINEKYLIYFAVIISLLTYYFTSYFFNVNDLMLKKGKMNENIKSLEIELEEKKVNEKTNSIIEIYKKPIYLDIDFYINTTKYGIKYTDIEYKEKKWYLKGVAESLKILDKFSLEVEKLNKDIEILSLTDNEDGIKFEYIIEDNKV